MLLHCQLIGGVGPDQLHVPIIVAYGFIKTKIRVILASSAAAQVIHA
jgi:hypothetical protein